MTEHTTRPHNVDEHTHSECQLPSGVFPHRQSPQRDTNYHDDRKILNRSSATKANNLPSPSSHIQHTHTHTHTYRGMHEKCPKEDTSSSPITRFTTPDTETEIANASQSVKRQSILSHTNALVT